MGEVPGRIARSVRVRERKREVIAAARAWAVASTIRADEATEGEWRLMLAVVRLSLVAPHDREREHG